MTHLSAVPRLWAPVLAVLLACHAPVLAQDVFVVDDDGGPGVDFTHLPPAIEAATDGDIVLVRSSALWGDLVVFGGKSLTITADAGAQILMARGMTVGTLGPGKQVVLAGFDLWPSQFADFPKHGLHVQSGAGSVWILDSTFRGGTAVPEAPDECQALRAVNTQSVVLVDCELQGGSGSATWPPAFPGLEANDSRVSLFGCQVTGGESAVDSRDFPGNAAVDATGGVIYAAGCALSGGEDPELDTSPGILADGSALALLASTFPGTGPTVVQQGGELLELDGTPRTFDVSSPVRERQPLGISASGEPGEAVWLAVDVKALFLLAPVHAAPLLVDASLLLVPVGTIGLDGQLALSVPAPQLPSSWEGATIFMQALFVAPPDPVLLSNPDALVLLDESL